MKLLALLSKKDSSGSEGSWTDNGGSSGGYGDIVTTEKGIVDNTIDKIGNKIGDRINSKISEYTTYLVSDLISIIEIGAIGFGFYQCISVMFFSNKMSKGGAKPMDKIIFSYFIFFLLRILNTVVKVRGGISGR